MYFFHVYNAHDYSVYYRFEFRRSLASGLRSCAFGGRAWAHFPKQRLVIKPRNIIKHIIKYFCCY